MKLIRKRLSEKEIVPPNLRYNPETDTIQFGDGDNWVDVPQADPRHGETFLLPPLTPGENVQCDAAARIVAAWQEAVDLFVTSTGVAQFGTLMLELLLVLAGGTAFLGPVGLLIDLIIIVFYALVAIGTANIEAAFTSEVWDGILCIVYCHVDENGQVSSTAREAIMTDIADQYPGTVYGTLNQVQNLFGEVLMSNATVERTETGDCSECDCTTCVDALNGNGQQGWAAYSGELANGCTTTYEAVPDRYYNDVNCSSWVFCCAVQNVASLTSIQATVSGQEFSANPAWAWEFYVDGVSQGYHQTNSGEVTDEVIEFIPATPLTDVEIVIRFWMAERVAGDASGWAEISAITLCS